MNKILSEEGLTKSDLKIRSTLTLKEVKKLISSEKSMKKYRATKEKQDLLTLSETFREGPIDYDILEKNIREVYQSGDRLEDTIALKKKHFQRYYESKINKYLLNPIESKRPKIGSSITFGSFSIPKIYRVNSFQKGMYSFSPLSFDMPRQFIYSDTMDRVFNLARWSGIIAGRPYKTEELRFETQVQTYWNRSEMSERDILKYIFDLMPYAIRFANEKWITAIAECNRNNVILTDIVDVEPLVIRGSEHIRFSSECIPFEIQGKLYTLTLDEYMEILELYRNPGDYYDTAQCDNEKLFILHLIYKKEKDYDNERIKAFLLSDDSPLRTGYGTLEEVITQVPDDGGLSEKEIYYYYASSNQRTELDKLGFLGEEKSKVIFMSDFGYREMLLGMKEIGVNREQVIEQWALNASKDDEILQKYNNIYGLDISRTGQSYDFSAVGDYDLEESLDFFFDDEEEYLSLETLQPEKIDRSDTVFETDFATWNTFGSDPLDPARRTWDPGGESRIQDPGRMKPPAI